MAKLVRKIPQVRREGELTDSVKLIAETNPMVEVLEGLTVMQHRLGIFQGFLDCEQDGYVRAEIDGLTNTLRFKHKKPLVEVSTSIFNNNKKKIKINF